MRAFGWWPATGKCTAAGPRAALLDALVEDPLRLCGVRPLPLSGAGRRAAARQPDRVGRRTSASTRRAPTPARFPRRCWRSSAALRDRRPRSAAALRRDDAQAAAKFAAVKGAGMMIFCVGERWQNATPARRGGRRAAVARGAGTEFFRECGAGLRAGLGDRHRAQRDPEQAQAVHASCLQRKGAGRTRRSCTAAASSRRMRRRFSRCRTSTAA